MKLLDGGAKLLSTIYANCGYWQIHIDEADRDKTAFTSHHSLFRFVRMSVGFKNAPGTFQRYIDIILASVYWKPALFYLYDVGIFSKTAENHNQYVRSVISHLQQGGV